MTLPAGRGEYRFADVALYIEPETVRFKCLTSPRGVSVLEHPLDVLASLTVEVFDAVMIQL